MKKVLLSTAAVGLAMVATPAHAQLKVDLGGWFKGYGFWTDQDESPALVGTGVESRDFDIIRQTEVHVGGETTLDNGLTVGMHLEMEADGNYTDGFGVQESYAYFSGPWGRVNFGAEDGAAYLLQVEAPSGDSNLDGIRQYVNPVNYLASPGVPSALNALDVFFGVAGGGLDYDQDVSGYADKLTYLTPIMNGFQAGFSYTPDLADASSEDAFNFNDVDGAFGSVYEGALRYEGAFNNVGVILGAGYTHVDLEGDFAGVVPTGSPSDDRTAWNVGADFDIGPFGIGAAYMVDDFGDTDVLAGVPESTIDDEQTFVVGADYTTGPFKIGGSWLHSDNVANILGFQGPGETSEGVDAERWTGGVVYTYGPGMTFRGSVSHVSLDNVDTGGPTSDNLDATSVLVGTQINF